MALVHTAGAIGAVTNVLITRLNARTGLTIVSGRPEKSANKGRRLNLFLYETLFDPHLKNEPLDEGQKPPLWVVLKYLITAFDAAGASDSADAHADLGLGLRALQDTQLLSLNGLTVSLRRALDPNPEALQITFDEAPVELLSKVMQGSDESYRLSAAFQVRPVMIALGSPPTYSLLVGIDYTPSPPVVTDKFLGLDVLASIGPRITGVEPPGFVPGDEVTVTGEDLHLANLSVRLGPVELPVTMQQPDRLRFVVNPALANGSTIAAGSHPLSVVQQLPSGRTRASNLLIANLLPTLTAITAVLPAKVAPPPPVPPPTRVFTTLEITGELLGRAQDDVFLALYREGRTVQMLDDFKDLVGSPQTHRQVIMQTSEAVPEGNYLAILKVNGQQALQSLPVNLTP